jgi:hypothetical protein
MREEFEKAFHPYDRVEWVENRPMISNLYGSTPLEIARMAIHFARWEGWQAATALRAERVRELEDKVQMLASLLNEHVANDQLNWDEDEWIERAAKAIYEIPFDGDSEVEQALIATAREG